MTLFNMDPVCPLDPSNPFFCLEGNYADWVSDFLETSGQERLRQDDARLTADDYAMPDWCFLDGPDPDWDDLCTQWNTAKYTQVDANIEWQISDNLTMLSTTGLSEFSSSGVSDWQLLGMEFRPSQVESDVLYQEFQFNFSLGDGRVDFAHVALDLEYRGHPSAVLRRKAAGLELDTLDHVGVEDGEEPSQVEGRKDRHAIEQDQVLIL
jgi:hypothetical protein